MYYAPMLLTTANEPDGPPSLLNRELVLTYFAVSAEGRITSPGKFQGEMAYVPYFWSLYLDGCADRDDGDVLGFDVGRKDREMFPELKGRRTVNLIEDFDGFVREVR